MLSRYPILPVTTSDLEEMNTLEADDVDFPLDYHTIANEQSNDRSIRTNTRFTQSALDNVQLYFYKNKIVIPKSLVSRIISWYHSSLCHPGAQRTFRTINMHFYAPNLDRTVREFVRKCPDCAVAKRTLPKYGKLPLPVDTIFSPWEVIPDCPQKLGSKTRVTP